MDKIGKKGRLDGEIAGGNTDRSSDERLSSAWTKALRLSKNQFFKKHVENQTEKFKNLKGTLEKRKISKVDFMMEDVNEKPKLAIFPKLHEEKKNEKIKSFGLPTLKELDSQRAVIKGSDSSDSLSSSGPTFDKSSKSKKLKSQFYSKEARNISDIIGSPNLTYTVNPVVVEIEAKPYQRTEHKIVVRNDNSENNDLGWFKRLLPEEYFKKPTLKRNLPIEPKMNVEVKEKFIINKPQKNENFNVDDLMPEKFYKKEEEVEEKKEPQKIEMKMLKLPRLPYERCKKLGKYNVSMIESSDDSIRTKEVLSRPDSANKRFSYDRSLFADARKMFFTEIRKERNRREEERRRNFNKLFATFNHTSKTQEELFKSKDLESFCRREGLNVLYQKHAERKVDETILQKWQRLGRKFYPEALHEELRFRRQHNKVYEEYKPVQKVQPVKKPEIPIPSVIPRPAPKPCAQTELDKTLILKGVDQAIKVEHVKKEVVQPEVKKDEESKKLDKAVQLSATNVISKKENVQNVKSYFAKAKKVGETKRMGKKIKKGKRKAKRKHKKVESEITTINSDVFDKTNSSKPVQGLAWPQVNTNVYLVQTEHPNVPSLVEMKKPSESEKEKSDREWSQYGRTASETDRLLSSLTQRIKEKLNSPKKPQKMRNPRKVSESTTETRETLRSMSFSGFDVEKGVQNRKFTSDTSVCKNNFARLLEKFPEEIEQMKPVLLPKHAEQFSTSTMNLSFMQKTESMSSFSTSKWKGKTEKCSTMTSSLEASDLPSQMTNRIDNFFKEIKETSQIDIHRTNAVLNVQKLNYDLSSQSFLDVTYSEAGEKIIPNSGVGHRFFRTPPTISADLIEIKKECEDIDCQRSQTDIVPHLAQAMINIHFEEPESKRELEAGDSIMEDLKIAETPEETDSEETSELDESNRSPLPDADSVPKDSTSAQTCCVSHSASDRNSPSSKVNSVSFSAVDSTVQTDKARKST